MCSDGGSWYRIPLLTVPESVYLAGLLPLELYCSAIHYLLRLHLKLPFLPLLLTSLYCSVGVIYAFVRFYRTAFTIGQQSSTSSKMKKE
jgi:alpha-1,3-glucosyltransferase